MNRVKQATAFVAVLIIILCGSGCSFDFTSVDSLMRAPKLTGEYADVERAFEEAVGTSVSLQSPRGGEFRTAFVLYDYDADGEEEAIAFYTTPTDETRVHIHFLDRINGDWISVGDEVGNEREVYELLFRDLNDDGAPEIIVNFNTRHSNRTMSVYSITPSREGESMKVQLMSTVQYTSFVCIDMDLDGTNEILYTVLEVSVDTGINVPYVRILKYIEDSQGKRIDVVSSLSLYNGVTAVESMAVDSTNDAVRVYIDCLYHDAATMITEVVTWSADNGFFLLLHKYESAALLKTTRTYALHTVDLDKDGIMEIPGEYEMPDSVFENVAEGMIPVAIGRNYYRCMNDGTLVLHKADFIDPAGRYTMDLLTLGYYGRICILFDFITESTSYYLYDSVNMVRGERLFTLTVKDVNNETGAYFDISTTGTALGLTPELIRNTLTMSGTEVK